MKKVGLTKILGKIKDLEYKIRKEWEGPKNGMSFNHLGFLGSLGSFEPRVIGGNESCAYVALARPQSQTSNQQYVNIINLMHTIIG